MHFFHFLLLTFISLVLPFLLQFSNARIFSLEMHHRYSEPVKKWSTLTGTNSSDHHWPVKGSVDYYARLAGHDHVLRGRKLSELNGMATFSDGNSTFRINSLGFLHYTTVTLGTPGLKFMVALDTGSDLFWVPCECGRCATTDDALYSSDFELSIYSPNRSTSSKQVSCSNSLCTHRSGCIDTFSHCPYTVAYVSSETSTSGILVEDVLHLKTEDSDQEVFAAQVIFGCGQVQTGSFLDVAAPNGLFGLGFEKISVPSILAREGYVADSFSMCFGLDGTGRINFGDKGSYDQDETPFNIEPSHPTYDITVTQIRVGTSLIDSEFRALFDSGTSFTYLVEPFYTMVSESFHRQAQDKQRPPDKRIPFEYCYDMSPDANTSLIPTLSLTMQGGGQYIVYDPIIVISTQNELVYCLAIVKGKDLNIIGQNFMTGYRIVFDRERLVLGWKKSDCYEAEELHQSSTKPRNSTTVPPAVAAGLNNGITKHSGDRSRSSAVNSVALPVHYSKTAHLILFWLAFLLM